MARPIDAYQAIDIIDEWLDSVGTVMVGKGLSSYGELIGCIEDAPTLTPPNEPLTLERLREMDGEPAYIPETNCWVLVTQNPFVPLFTWPDGEQCSAYDWYEQVGPVYRRPPEGEANA